MIALPAALRLTQYAHGGGGGGKLPPAALEHLVAGLTGPAAAGLLTGAGDGDDAAVLRIDRGQAVVSAAGFHTPVLDDPYDWGRVAAAHALSNVYAVGGTPVLALNLLAWPCDGLAPDLAREVLRGGRDTAAAAGCVIAGGHSVDDPVPKYGLAVTGSAQPDALLRLSAGAPGVPLSLSKPLGLGTLNARHRATGETFPGAVETMAALNAGAARLALAGGAVCATDVGGFGLLGHLYKLARASGVTAVVDAAAVPFLDGARESVRDGFVPGGTRRNLAWVTPRTDFGGINEEERLLLADAQTSGGLLVAGEIPGAPVIGELIPAGPHPLIVR
ncbi:selenide, water dikinase SelD [Actinomadura flavalba]|uniref:selenide, water dikinase SelD n=1 Tax=Actinomadura flavalba TaxID=1120938 RepID=UPI0003635EF9|nr:selenide, water dikinase SelD [Actinomadura flavalba]